MGDAVNVAEVWRGSFLESRHRGRAVVCNARGEVIAAWGDADQAMLPRSSCKMLQALPLVESGAAARFGLGPEQLALSCASHQGAPVHTRPVTRWLSVIDRAEDDLACGAQRPADRADQDALARAGEQEGRRHNNCSGKHTGFLTLERHIGGGAEYVAPDHPVQKSVRAAFEEMCGETASGYAIDGCSAPNFGTSLKGLATAMARMADPAGLAPSRAQAAEALVQAMKAHPELVAGEGRACTGMMRAMSGPTVVKTGAEGVFTAILPDRGLGVALKIDDGATRAAECAMAALLVRLGVAAADHPEIQARLSPVLRNFDNLEVGRISVAAELWDGGRAL